MKTIEAAYRLIECGENEWMFQESSEMAIATEKFDAILAYHDYGSSAKLSNDLRRFLLKYPKHFDALHHFARYLLSKGKFLDAFVFSQTAVATGLRAFPKKFVVGQDRLPTGFTQNRPFLRALSGLMLAQRSLGLLEDAIESGELCLAFDQEDRMGARDFLAIYLLECNRDNKALELFGNPNYGNSFFTLEYLYALALVRLDRQKEAKKILSRCLFDHPQIARFILNSRLPQPLAGSEIVSIINGSELEGWVQAQRIGFLWRNNRKCLKFLRRESQLWAEQDWKRYFNPKLEEENGQDWQMN